MRKFSNDLFLRIKPEFCIGLALIILVLPIRWILAWLIAAAIHELFHYAALRICGCKVYGMRIGLGGVIMETEDLTCGREFVCSLAGPLGGLALLLIARWFPRTAICGCFQALYNLLPIFPLDGGRAMRSLLRRLLPRPTADRISTALEYGIFVILGLLSAYASFALSLGPLPMLFVIILLLKNKKIKIPCKREQQRVQ